MKNILFFGDSLTAGYGLKRAEHESFPALIAQLIRQAALPYEVVNAGLSGDTTLTGLQRLQRILNQQIDVFVLALGANDLLRGIPPEATYRNLEKIVMEVKLAHPLAKILLIGMELPAWIPGERVAAFRNLFSRLAKAHELEFIPFLLEGVGGIRHLNMPDGLHPLAEGYQIIAQTVWKKLQPIL
ncbi:MAG: arylesterase [Pedobacter sp.]|nr:arylesterase [Pedobacter sp.]MDQ8054347.1 arylesterase [Pedobacter sp.]